MVELAHDAASDASDLLAAIFARALAVLALRGHRLALGAGQDLHFLVIVRVHEYVAELGVHLHAMEIRGCRADVLLGLP